MGVGSYVDPPLVDDASDGWESSGGSVEVPKNQSGERGVVVKLVKSCLNEAVGSGGGGVTGFTVGPPVRVEDVEGSGTVGVA